MPSPADAAAAQSGVVSMAQALATGLSRDQVRHRVRRGSWQRLHPGVFLVHAAEPPFLARVWAGLLYAGPSALASHRTAAWLQGLLDREPEIVELTVDDTVRVRPRAGLRVVRSLRVGERRHPVREPPQTRVEETVLDLVASAGSPDEVITWVLRACQRRLTTPARLVARADLRSRLPRRQLLGQIVEDARAGVASALEARYRHDVEEPHQLPTGERGGSWIGPDGRRRYFDVRYVLWRLRIELEGLAYHPLDRAHVDRSRDNAAVLQGDVVLRYGWPEVTGQPCLVAAQVAAALALRGWPGPARRCGPDCRVPTTTRTACVTGDA